MKMTVKCKCGSAFNAPASLIGQVVKCPACSQTMTIPDPTGASGPARLGDMDASHTASLSHTGRGAQRPAAAPAAGRSASHAGTRSRAPAPGNKARADTELCPRCQAVHVEAGRLCTSCLYELHTGNRAGPRKFKFTIGLGVSAAILILAVGIGVYIIKTNYTAAPTVSNRARTTVAEHNGTADGAAGETGGEATARVQKSDPAVQWSEPSLTRYDAVSRTTIEAAWDPLTGRQDFTVRLVPRRQSGGLNMATTAALYRATEEAGPFTQVDQAAVSDLEEATGALIFALSDGQAIEAGLSQVYYRVAGMDGQGRRLFDTPPAAFAVIPPPRIMNGRLTWTPVGGSIASAGVPPIQCVLAVDAPGWEHIALAEVKLDGPTNTTIPSQASGLPVRAMLTTVLPSRIELVSGGSGAWVHEPALHQIGDDKAADKVVRGIAPVWSGSDLSYALLPGPEAFEDLRETPLVNGTAAEGPGGTVLSFRLANQATPQLLELPTVPAPTSLTVTPFDGAVHLTWDTGALQAAADRFAGPIRVAIFRTATDGARAVVAVLPLEQTSYIDAAVENGVAYHYQVQVTSAAAPDVPPLLKAQAWLAGQGPTPVLVRVEPGAAAGGTQGMDSASAAGGVPVVPEASLSQLHLSMAAAELCYPYTCQPMMAVAGAIREAVREQNAAGLIERGMLERAAKPVSGGLPGSPAHVELRIVDAVSAEGTMIELWAADLVSGEQTRLAASPVASLDPATFVQPVMRLIEMRQSPKDAASAAAQAQQPTMLVLAPLTPVDQMRRFYGSEALHQTLIEAASEQATGVAVMALSAGGDVSAGAVLLSGRTWNNDDLTPGLVIHAIDAGTGLLLDIWHEPKVDRGTGDRFAQWCSTLQVQAAPAAAQQPQPMAWMQRPSPQSTSISPLLETEAALGPIHPVWQAMGGGGGASSSLNGNRMAMLMTAQGPANAVTLPLGLPLPAELQPFQPPSRRDASDPLATIRPYRAASLPPRFDLWADRYAEYVKADYDAFRAGLARVGAALAQVSPAPLVPHFIIRGEPRPVGSATIIGPVRLSDDPTTLNVRGFFPMGVSGQPMVEYRRELDETFRTRPWASYHAWKKVAPGLAEPFLKGVLLGVENSSYGRLDMSFTLAPPIHQYVAAVLLDEMGNDAGTTYRRKAIGAAAQTLREVAERNPQSLTSRQSFFITNAMLILTFENDPGAIQMLSDPQRLNRYLVVEAEQTPDMLRLLVDRVGPTAWQWVASGDGRQRMAMAWDQFLWRSADEMRMVADAMPDALPDDLHAHMRRSLGGTPTPDDPGRGPSAPGSFSTPAGVHFRG